MIAYDQYLTNCKQSFSLKDRGFLDIRIEDAYLYIAISIEHFQKLPCIFYLIIQKFSPSTATESSLSVDLLQEVYNEAFIKETEHI